jgi:leucyl aminopeptidase
MMILGKSMRASTAFACLSVLLAAAPALAARPISFAAQAPTDGTLVVPLASAAELDARAASLDAGVRAAVGRALASARFDYKPRSTLSLRGIGGYDRILVVGTAGAGGAAALQDAAGLASRETVKDAGSVALLAGGYADGAQAAQLGVGAALGNYRFDRYKLAAGATRPAEKPFIVVTPAAQEAERAFARDGRALADAVAFARDLITEPSNIIYPESFVERTRAAFQGVRGVTIEALDVAAMERLGMNAILSVGRGSARPPRLLLVEYRGGGSAAPIVLAGKGITFDSGGISIKPGDGMWRMKYDMSGAAAITAAVLSLAKSGAPVNAVAVAALAENMPSGTAARPGDVVRAYNGKTIEIINTDAEGRLVLADAVSYAERRYKPAAVVDAATLTGAVRTALGDDYAGLFSRHDGLADQLIAASRATGEGLWRLPLHESYAEDTKSDIADIKNSVEGSSGPGAGFGAHFIGAFVTPQTPWAHLDIAGMAWTTTDSPTVPKGAAGFAVRLLDRFARDFRPLR